MHIWSPRTKAKRKIQKMEFRLRGKENLPVADNSVDVIISNCVIKLSYTKTYHVL
jgi:ubiquinone/menaquinone biosynthesis C-methylase UbiE